MIYCFDIDGTICSDLAGQYHEARPYQEVITAINNLYDAGHIIILWTARGTTTKKPWRAFTEAQLKKWKVKYHELQFGKPEADVFVDDKGIPIEQILRSIPLLASPSVRRSSLKGEGY